MIRKGVVGGSYKPLTEDDIDQIHNTQQLGASLAGSDKSSKETTEWPEAGEVSYVPGDICLYSPTRRMMTSSSSKTHQCFDLLSSSTAP